LIFRICFFLIAGKDVQEFEVKKPLNIVDTNGAGDSFVGGIFDKDL
jgi:sugar/nucleoside kinase (ribokinase family)